MIEEEIFYNELMNTLKKLIDKINKYENKVLIVECKNTENEKYKNDIKNRLNRMKYKILGNSLFLISFSTINWTYVNDFELEAIMNYMSTLKEYYNLCFNKVEAFVLVIDGILPY